MKLLRLKLENWRGVESHEVKFADAVTLIEGPNEVGKSTIIEALQALLKVMDSSSKAEIKAIQPVGTDVGSSVEAEIHAGDYHFTYSKTYNRDKQTTLNVLAPQPEQLTGREAHERVEQILEESVDMALWNALLVEQGNEIAGVTLSQSDGLARALDEAAGGESPEQDDSDLFMRVQAEYEQHFTLKTGKPKYAALEGELNEARNTVADARVALAEVETDGGDHERCIAEINRLETELPELQKEEREHEANWQAVGKVKELVTTKQKELESANQLLKAANDDLERRQSLIKSVDTGTRELKEAHEELAPQAEQVAELKKSADTASTALNEAKAKLKQVRAAADLARADTEHLGNAAKLESANKKLKQLQGYSEKLAAARKALQGIKINPDGLEELREADGELQVALAKVNTAASSIEITAEDKLKLSLNDDSIELKAGESEERDFAAELQVAIPGVANIRVMPSQSASELESEAAEHRETFERLLKEYGVKDLPDAVGAETKRAADEQEADSWVEKIDDLLGGETEADWQAYADDLEVRCKDYLAHRAKEPALPAKLEEAEAATAAAKEASSECEAEVEELRDGREELNEAYNNANIELHTAQTDANGLAKVLEQQQEELEKVRAAEDDQAIQQRATERTAAVDSVQEELAALNQQLESASPEAAEALFSNAQAARARAAKELADQEMQLAVLEDRLIKAQADGRFEALEAGEIKLAALEREYNATNTRASAAKRLWEVLSVHRDDARKAYVRPLKEGVEQLGEIVFGSDFAIDLGNDWELVSCTRDGKTIPFDDLSVGAKEQLGILMRLAAARIVSSQGGVPLIIDDALGFSDPSRLKTMGAAIASAGNDCQVILLTCTPGRFTHVGSAEVVRF